VKYDFSCETECGVVGVLVGEYPINVTEETSGKCLYKYIRTDVHVTYTHTNKACFCRQDQSKYVYIIKDDI